MFLNMGQIIKSVPNNKKLTPKFETVKFALFKSYGYKETFHHNSNTNNNSVLWTKSNG